MVDIVLFHHAQGRTSGVQACADRLIYPGAGHLVAERGHCSPEIAEEILTQTLAFLVAVDRLHGWGQSATAPSGACTPLV